MEQSIMYTAWWYILDTATAEATEPDTIRMMRDESAQMTPDRYLAGYRGSLKYRTYIREVYRIDIEEE